MIYAYENRDSSVRFAEDVPETGTYAPYTATFETYRSAVCSITLGRLSLGDIGPADARHIISDISHKDISAAKMSTAAFLGFEQESEDYVTWSDARQDQLLQSAAKGVLPLAIVENEIANMNEWVYQRDGRLIKYITKAGYVLTDLNEHPEGFIVSPDPISVLAMDENDHYLSDKLKGVDPRISHCAYRIPNHQPDIRNTEIAGDPSIEVGYFDNSRYQSVGFLEKLI